MKNSKLKSALVSGSLAIFASVLAIGVNAALGADVAPPGDLTNPTFSGINLEGPAQDPSANPLVVGDDLSVTGVVTADSDVEVGNDLKISGFIKNPNALTAILGGLTRSMPGVLIDGELYVGNPGHVDITGKLFNSDDGGIGQQRPLVVQDDLTVTGNLVVNGATASLPIQRITEDVGKDWDGYYSGTLVCPLGMDMISCDIAFGMNANLVFGPYASYSDGTTALLWAGTGGADACKYGYSSWGGTITGEAVATCL